MQQSQCKPDTIVFNATIAACESAAQWAHSIALLRIMPLHKLHPSILGYNSAISACAKNRVWECAVLLMEALRSEKERLQPTVVCFNSVLLHLHGQQWRVALLLLGELYSLEITPDMTTLRGVTVACEAGGCLAQLRVLMVMTMRLLAASVCQAQADFGRKEEEALEAVLAACMLRACGSFPGGLDRALGRRHEAPAARALYGLSVAQDKQGMRVAARGRRSQQSRLYDEAFESTSSGGLGSTFMRCVLETAAVQPRKRRLACMWQTRPYCRRSVGQRDYKWHSQCNGSQNINR